MNGCYKINTTAAFQSHVYAVVLYAVICEKEKCVPCMGCFHVLYVVLSCSVFVPKNKRPKKVKSLKPKTFLTLSPPIPLLLLFEGLSAILV